MVQILIFWAIERLKKHKDRDNKYLLMAYITVYLLNFAPEMKTMYVIG